MRILQAALLIGLYGLVVSLGCATQQKPPEPSIRALKSRLDIVLMNEKGETSEMKSLFVLYEYKDYRVFQMPVQQSMTDIFVNKDGNIVRDSVYSMGETYRYIVSKKGNNQGQYYRRLDSLPRLIAVDSFLKQQTVFNMEVGLSNLFTSSSLVSTEWTKGNDRLFEQYLTTMKKDSTYADSTFLSYRNDLKDYEMTLSNKVDSTKGIKLSEVRLIFLKWPKEKFVGGRIQTKEILISIEPVAVDSKVDILNLVEKFEKHKRN